MAIDWKSLIGHTAPALATALGGPLAGAAAQALSAALLGKKDATTDELAAVITAGGPELALKLRQAEIDFQLQLQQNGIKLAEIDAGDRANARSRQVALHDHVADWLACLVVAAFLMMTLLPWVVSLSGPMHDVATRAQDLTQASMMIVLGYYFGSSSASRGSSSPAAR